MAASGKKNMFNEATSVQMPAMVHLTRLGYTYFGKITEDMACLLYTSISQTGSVGRMPIPTSLQLFRMIWSSRRKK